MTRPHDRARWRGDKRHSKAWDGGFPAPGGSAPEHVAEGGGEVGVTELEPRRLEPARDGALAGEEQLVRHRADGRAQGGRRDGQAHRPPQHPAERLRQGTVRGIQIRYAYDEKIWRDTLLRSRSGGIRIVRMIEP